MRSEPADGGSSSSNSSTQMTELEKEYMGNVAATAGAAATTAIGGIFGGAAAGMAAAGGSFDIQFDEDGVNQLIKYFQKVKNEEMDTAKRKASALEQINDPGHPEGSRYSMSVQQLGSNYLEYHGKLANAIDKTIETLQKAKEQYRSNDDSHAQTFKSGVSE